MSQTPEPATPGRSSAGAARLTNRPFRVKLRGSVLMLIRLPNQRQLRGNLHQISTTGGLLHVEKPLDEKLVVELIFHMGGTTVREKAQMMFPMWATQGWLQPFRFVELPERSKGELETTLRSFVPRPQEPGPQPIPEQHAS